MATIVNNPPVERNNHTGLIVGVILFIVLVILFFYYGLPALQNVGSTQVTVPEKIDVNINTQ